MLTVTYINRQVRQGNFSIEGIFDLVKTCLKDKIKIDNYYYNPGLSRLRNIANIKKHAGTINHITGDVNFLAMGLKGKKNILTIHDFGHYEKLKKSPLRFIIYRLVWFYLPLKNVDIVTVVSDFTKEKLIAYFNFPRENIRVINNPVKPVFKFTPNAGLNAIPNILQIGTGPHKNLDGLIEAVKGLKVKLTVVGWPDEQLLNKLTAYQIDFSVLNNLSDNEMYQQYVNCDILFFASFHEGFGMPIIEAQAVGRPVITSNMGAMKEVGENSAVLVNPSDTDEIRAAITRLFNDEIYYSNTVDAGKRNALNYRYETIADSYLRVYNELAITPGKNG